MIFSAKVLQNAFDKAEVSKLEEEINRLFRSNAFNISQRNQFEEQRKKKFPQLVDPPAKETNAEMIKRLEQRFRIPKYLILFITVLGRVIVNRTSEPRQKSDPFSQD